jgi:hypothetical protein
VSEGGGAFLLLTFPWLQRLARPFVLQWFQSAAA